MVDPGEGRAHADLLQAGRVGAPHGLDGSFHVIDGQAELLAATDVVVIDGIERAIERRAGHERRPILRVAGCATRESAQALRGSELMVARSVAPALEDDEWWAEDLEGLVVRDGDRQIGTVARLLGLPSCEVLEVTRSDHPTSEPLLVPLVSDAVRTVDLEAGAIDVDLGFLGEE